MDHPVSERPPLDSSRPTRPEQPAADVLSWLAYGGAKTRRVAPVVVKERASEEAIDEGWSDGE